MNNKFILTIVTLSILLSACSTGKTHQEPRESIKSQVIQQNTNPETPL